VSIKDESIYKIPLKLPIKAEFFKANHFSFSIESENSKRIFVTSPHYDYDVDEHFC